MTSLNEVKSVVDNFVENQKLFTSLDIANEVKSKGNLIRNSQVSNELKYLRT